MARKESADKSVPHTRIDDESWIWKAYEPGTKIGQGTFGKVFKVQHQSTQEYWAMKVVNKEKAGTSAVKLLEREVAILKRVEHENIINLNEVFETGKKMYLLMELCEGGELADAVKERHHFSEAETKVIVKKLASAISYLHKNDIVHRDLKLENILLSQNPNDPEDKLHIKMLKIGLMLRIHSGSEFSNNRKEAAILDRCIVTDFGLSVVKGGVGHDNMMQDFCGTPIYMSPEIIDNKSYSQQCDVWAMGVIVYILLSGVPPFRSKDEDTLYDLIKKGSIDFSDRIWADKSVQVKECISGMLKLDPAHRLTASEVLHHPWITGELRDGSQPTNVLEMMKKWSEELKQEEGKTCAINGEVDQCDGGGVEIPPSPAVSPPQNGSVSTNGKAAPENTRKGSGGTKKPGSGGKSVSSRTSAVTNATKSSLTPGNRASTGSKSPAPQRLSSQSPTKQVNNSATKLNSVPTSKARGTKK